jgi:hypothetical protein
MTSLSRLAFGDIIPSAFSALELPSAFDWPPLIGKLDDSKGWVNGIFKSILSQI